MKYILIADTFPPLKNSGAIQLRDLSREFVKQGHQLLVILPCSSIKKKWVLECCDGFNILRLKSLKLKDISYFRRTLHEIIMPHLMYRIFKSTPFYKANWDGVIWYSPSIFLAHFAKLVKLKSSVYSYLIIRDIFPHWACDLGLIKNKLVFNLFNAFADYQYKCADIIGIQSPSNIKYFNHLNCQINDKVEVLHNWLDKPVFNKSSIDLRHTTLFNRKIFVYAGNMGVAQGLDVFVRLAKAYIDNNHIGFVFVGRGSEVDRLRKLTIELSLNNLLFFDEISPDEIPSLYKQCFAGIVSLDLRHKSHNIPGKFLTYIQSGLPVLALINKGNDLKNIIEINDIGVVVQDDRVSSLVSAVEKMLIKYNDSTVSERCENIFNETYAVSNAVRQITNALVTVATPS